MPGPLYWLFRDCASGLACAFPWPPGDFASMAWPTPRETAAAVRNPTIGTRNLVRLTMSLLSVPSTVVDVARQITFTGSPHWRPSLAVDKMYAIRTQDKSGKRGICEAITLRNKYGTARGSPQKLRTLGNRLRKGQLVNFLSAAQRTSSARLVRPSFPRMWARWLSTVRTERKSWSAICRFVRPLVRSFTTSTSRLVRPSEFPRRDGGAEDRCNSRRPRVIDGWT